jgi:glycerol-3-phosphate dehydrogenase
VNASTPALYDVAVIGGGINGTGIARDAAGRGLKVLLVEKDDLAAHTSSLSTKLIHGGLRYLEHYEFHLVSEALSEREVLLQIAPHIIEPLQFVLPHEPHLRPAWMIRCGLFLYDHIGGRRTLPSSFGVDLAASKWGAGLKDSFRKGFVYSDARVDDARLVVFNAIGARALVNAAGPWVKKILDQISPGSIRADVRHVKGSHIVVPRVHPEPHAYILQNSDKRIVFVIPFQGAFSLIGTTDIPVEDYDAPRISADEVDYLCSIANAYLARPLGAADVVWTYSGVRPLYDDGSADPSAITRDYVLKLDAGDGRAPMLSIFGGKITTYRKLAEHALAELRAFFPQMQAGWTHRQPLPGGDLPRGGLAAYERELAARYPALPTDLLAALARRHGTRTPRVLGAARTPADLGRHFGDTLYVAEIDWLVAQEWAIEADDVLWRRTKCGLHLSGAERDAVAEYLRSRGGPA